MPKDRRIVTGLRPDVGAFRYSGNLVVDVCSALIAQGIVGRFPIDVLEVSLPLPEINLPAVIAGRSDLVATVEPLLTDLERRLAEASM